MHDPVQLPEAWRDKYKGKFDQGWDKYRDEILARQKKLGIVPPNTQLTPKPDIVPDWDTLSADEKKVATRYQELFAAFAELTDYEIGRVVQADRRHRRAGQHPDHLRHRRQRREPQRRPARRLQHVEHVQPGRPRRCSTSSSTLDEIGGPHSAMTPPAGWSIGDNTPFAYSQFHTQYGGTTNGAIVSWPKAIKAKGEIRNQYHHVIDIAPTVLEAAGLPQPKTVNGVAQKPIEGVSMLGKFNDAQAKSAHTVQYYEIYGNRGIYKDGWYAATLHKVSWEPKPRSTYADDKWELYNTAEDFISPWTQMAPAIR